MVVPGCVPAGIFRSTSPSTVRTLTEVPRMASVYGTDTLELMSTPSRLSSGSSLTVMKTYRSPSPPPRRPALPSPRTRKRLPESTPGGTFKLMVLERRTLPSPAHSEHGVKICPVPPHSGHTATCWKLPRGVLAMVMTCPLPPQVPQVLGVVPAWTPEPVHALHASRRTTDISFSAPNIASEKSNVRSYLSSSPCTGLFRERAPPAPPMLPPKKLSNRSKGFWKSPKPAAPAPMPPAPFRPSSPKRSYMPRFSSSDKTS
mmetsp:Transcript_3333/g.12072  ORF Transcript_3333/g.12072 Transcript_3333/m.12072 type:complete len:259 (-) Transcript_3333:448-1224(-)